MIKIVPRIKARQRHNTEQYLHRISTPLRAFNIVIDLVIKENGFILETKRYPGSNELTYYINGSV